MTRDSNAQPGDVFQTPYGDWRVLVSATSAGILLEQISRANTTLNTPSFHLNSTAATCALHGCTSGDERRMIERARKRLQKPVRKMKPTE
jgi:hypothetical protein